MSEGGSSIEQTGNNPERTGGPVRETSDSFLKQLRQTLHLSGSEKLTAMAGGAEGSALISLFQGDVSKALIQGIVGGLFIGFSWYLERRQRQMEARGVARQ